MTIGGETDGLSRRQLLLLTGGVGLAAAGYSSTGLTAPTASSAPAVDAARAAVMLCRDAWGARAARPGGRPHTIDRMTIHHSAVALPDNRGIVKRLQQHQRFHQDDRGWVDIA